MKLLRNCKTLETEIWHPAAVEWEDAAQPMCALCYFCHGNAVVLQCYRRQSMPTEQWKIRPTVTL